MRGAFVTCECLGVRLGRRRVLEQVSFELGAGIVSLVGVNGAGKTTLLRVLATLRRPSTGQVRVAGTSLRARGGLAAARRATGYLAQEPEHHANLRVREAVTYAAWLKAVPGHERPAKVDKVLADLDLNACADLPVGRLSGGTRRRAYLAQALVHEPTVVLLDEPTAGLDVDHRIELRELLRRQSADRLVLMSTHLTEDIELLSDRVLVLAAGRVRFTGTAAELAAHAPEPDDGTGASRDVERALQALTRGGPA
jgi:ABC-2 type transport system ATP-binding protein